MAWRESKDAGRHAFEDGNYHEALSRYSDAIDQLLEVSPDEGGARSRGTNPSEHQILLSNVVACRLKIGGTDMAAKAVDDAKKRALSLDRSNRVAREMLVNEMRRRNNRERNGDGDPAEEGEGSRSEGDGARSSPQTGNDSEYHPTEETPRHSFPEPSAPPHPSESTHENRGRSANDGIDVDDIEPPDAYQNMTISERIQHHFAQFLGWFYSQSDDVQTLLKVSAFFLVLYVALGGRFGLDYALGGNGGVGSRGNYGSGNAYDRYYSASSTSNQNQYSDGGRYRDGYSGSQRSSRSETRRASSEYNDRSNPQNDRHYSQYQNEQYYEPRGRQGGTSYHMPNLNNGSLMSMCIMLVIGLVCHRFGINPFQALWMLNLMQRGGRRRMGGMGGWGYGGYRGAGMGGGGFGFGRRRGFGQRGRMGYY